MVKGKGFIVCTLIFLIAAMLAPAAFALNRNIPMWLDIEGAQTYENNGAVIYWDNLAVGESKTYTISPNPRGSRPELSLYQKYNIGEEGGSAVTYTNSFLSGVARNTFTVTGVKNGWARFGVCIKSTQGIKQTDIFISIGDRKALPVINNATYIDIRGRGPIGALSHSYITAPNGTVIIDSVSASSGKAYTLSHIPEENGGMDASFAAYSNSGTTLSTAGVLTTGGTSRAICLSFGFNTPSDTHQQLTLSIAGKAAYGFWSSSIPDRLILIQGEKFTLPGITFYPTGHAESSNYTYVSSQPTRASVNALGEIEASTVNTGSTVISANADNGCGVDVSVRVLSPTEVRSIHFESSLFKQSNASLSLGIGQKEQLTAVVTMGDGVPHNYATWSTSNPSVATVVDGLVTGLGEGTAIIVAEPRNASDTAAATWEFKAAVCYVTVGPSYVQSVSLDETDISLVPGGTQQLTATVLPADAGDKRVDWTTSDNAIATVSTTGLVTAHARGYAQITATTRAGGHQAHCDVSVDGAVSSVTLNKQAVSLASGATEQLTATVLPVDAPDKTVTWSSSNGAVATVDVSGLVTAVSSGSALVSATANDGGLTASCAVTVGAGVASVTLDRHSIGLFPGETSQLTADVQPVSAPDKTLTWTSSNNAIATVDATGLVTGVVKGSAVITARANDGGVQDSCAVVVGAGVTSVTLDKHSIGLLPGETDQIVADVQPGTAPDKTLTWTSSNNSVATVNAAGLVTGVARGSAVITARANDGGVNDSCAVVVGGAVTSVTLNKNAINILPEGTEQLTADVQPGTAPDRTIAWTSSNNSVATVDASGLVTGVARGSAVITATANDGGKYDTCAVSVGGAVTSVMLDEDLVSVNQGATAQLTADVQPETAPDKSLLWTSSNNAIATVDASGLVTGVARGSAIITATANDGGKYDTCSVSVEGAVASVILDSETVSLLPGDTRTLLADVQPVSAPDKSLVWASSNNSVATVDASGFVTAVSKGYAIITATANDGGASDTCVVSVGGSVSSVSLNIRLMEIASGETMQLTAEVLPEDAPDKSLTWSSENEGVAMVDSTGRVTGVSRGVTIITARSNDNGLSSACTVNVTGAVTSITLNKTSTTLEIGDTDQLVPTVFPEDAPNKEVMYSTSDGSIATVSEDGLIEAVANGTAIITVYAMDGNVYATCVVIVQTGSGPEPVVPSVSLNKTLTTLEVGNTEQLVPTVSPADAPNKTLVWSSSNNAVATVSNTGFVEAVDKGTAVITATLNAGGRSATCAVSVEGSVTDVSLNKSTVQLAAGGQEQLVATVRPENAPDKSVTWETSDASVATVSNNGLVTAVSNGAAVVTVRTTDGDRSASCAVSVGGAEPVPTTVKLDATSLLLSVGGSRQLSATVLPATLVDRSVTWKSSNETVVTVSASGLVRAVKKGSAIITATARSGGASASCGVSVDGAAATISMEPKTIRLKRTGSAKITVTTVPSGSPYSLSVQDGSIAEIGSGSMVVGKKQGTTIITATLNENGVSASSVVAVDGAVEGIRLDKTGARLDVGATLQLSATVLPENAPDRRVLFGTSDETVATVSQSGLVTAVEKGTAIITAKTHEGGLSAHCAISVGGEEIPIPPSSDGGGGCSAGGFAPSAVLLMLPMLLLTGKHARKK